MSSNRWSNKGLGNYGCTESKVEFDSSAFAHFRAPDTTGWLGIIDRVWSMTTNLTTQASDLTAGAVDMARNNLEYYPWKNQLQKITEKKEATHPVLAQMIALILNGQIKSADRTKFLMSVIGVLPKALENDQTITMENKQDILFVLSGIEKFGLMDQVGKREIKRAIAFCKAASLNESPDETLEKSLPSTDHVEKKLENSSGPKKNQASANFHGFFTQSSDDAVSETAATAATENQCTHPGCSKGLHWDGEFTPTYCDFNSVQQPQSLEPGSKTFK